MALFRFLRKKNPVDGTYRRNRSTDYGQKGYGGELYDAVSGVFRMTVQDIFTITGRGTVVTGQIEAGSVSVGDTVMLRRVDGSVIEVTINGIEMFRKMMDSAVKGDNVGLLLRGVGKGAVGRGDVLMKEA